MPPPPPIPSAPPPRSAPPPPKSLAPKSPLPPPPPSPRSPASPPSSRPPSPLSRLTSRVSCPPLLPLPFTDAAGTLRAAPFRAALSTVALALGFLSLLVLSASLEALRLRAAALEADFGSDAFALAASPSAPPWPPNLPDILRRAFSSRAVVAAARAIPSPAAHPDLPCLAADPHWPDTHAWTWTSGRRPSPLDSPRDLYTSRARADALGWTLGRPLAFGDAPYRLAALHDGPPDAPLCFHASVDAPAPPEDAPPPSRSPTLLRFRALPPDTALTLRQSLAPLLPGLGVRDPEWLFPDELLAPLRRWRRILSVFASAAAALSLLLGAASLSALMLANAEKRIPEMGLRRALGARPADIFLLFLKDALLLVLLSFALAALAAPLAFAALPPDFPLALRFTPRILLPPALLASLLAVLASLPPALHTLRLSPSLALRSD